MKIPLYDEPTAAGIGNLLSDYPRYESMELKADEVPEKADYLVRISGDSIELMFGSGDLVFVEHDAPVESGEIGIFYLDEGAVCKKLHTD